jgi:hypothetical protein
VFAKLTLFRGSFQGTTLRDDLQDFGDLIESAIGESWHLPGAFSRASFAFTAFTEWPVRAAMDSIVASAPRAPSNALTCA